MDSLNCSVYLFPRFIFVLLIRTVLIGTVKQEWDPELVELPIRRFQENISEIISINDNDTSTCTITYDDDVEMTYGEMPKPLFSNERNVIKRENDPFSGDLPYNTNVSKF